MKKLTDNIKCALNALACQHAGDYLSMKDKLDTGSTKKRKHRREKPVRISAPPVRRMALLFCTEMPDATLDFVIDAANRHGQLIPLDLLLHGDWNADGLKIVETRLHEAGLDFHLIVLPSPASASIIDYLKNRTQLISLVARPDDKLARILIEQVMPGSGERLCVPIVLVGDKPPKKTAQAVRGLGFTRAEPPA